MKNQQLQNLETDLSADKSDALSVATLIQRTVVTCHATAEQAVGWTQEIKLKMKELEAKREAWVGPLKQVLKDMDATFKAVVGPLEEAEDVLKAKVVAWWEEMQKERERLLESVSAAPESERASILEAAASLEPKPIPGASFRQVDEVVVEDETRAFNWALENDTSLLTLDKKALARCKEEVPGVVYAKKTTLAIRGA